MILRNSAFSPSIIKRLLCFMFAFLMCAAAAACKPPDTPAVSKGGNAAEKPDFGGETITFCYPWETAKPGSSPAADRAAAHTKTVEKDFNVKIEYKSVNGQYYNTNMVNTILSGKPMGHILVCSGTFSADYLDSNIFADLSAAITESGADFKNINRYNQIVRQYSHFNGKQYGFASGTPGLTDLYVFNKRMLAEANIDLYSIVKKNEWTFDKLAEISKTLSKDKNNDGIYDVHGLGTQMAEFLAASLTIANNGALMKVNADGKPATAWRDANSIEALNFMYRLCAVDKTCTYAEGGTWQQGATDFANGKYAMMQCSIDYLPILQEIPMADDYGVICSPRGPKADSYRSGTYNMWFQFIPVTYKDRAADLLKLYDALIIEDRDNWLDGMDARVRDEESLKLLEELSFDSKRLIFDPTSIFGIEWAEPSFAMMLHDMGRGSTTVGAMIDSYDTQLTSLLNDKWKSHIFTGIDK